MNVKISWLMPGINRGTISERLLLVRRMTEQVCENVVFVHCSEIKFFYRVPDAIARITRAVSVTGIRRVGHQNPNELGLNRRGVQSQSRGSFLAVGHHA